MPRARASSPSVAMATESPCQVSVTRACGVGVWRGSVSVVWMCGVDVWRGRVMWVCGAGVWRGRVAVWEVLGGCGVGVWRVSVARHGAGVGPWDVRG